MPIRGKIVVAAGPGACVIESFANVTIARILGEHFGLKSKL
jgi:hypothetical protein